MVWDIVKIGLEDVANTFGIKEDLYSKYVEGEIKKNPDLIELTHKRDSGFDWTKETPLGGAGTTLNGCVLYCLIRHHNMKTVLETGVSGGYYSAFMLAALKKHDGWLTSFEISASPIVGNLVPEKLKYNKDGCMEVGLWNLQKNTDSLTGLKNIEKMDYDMYSHDSLHTLAHMTKEVQHFKRCDKNKFFIFVDDEKSDNFWIKSLQTNMFKKTGYDVKYISGAESRLNGHLGGFIQYVKK